MTSRETTPAGESAGASPVPRAAALAVLSEEPSTGLFPAAPRAASGDAAAGTAPAAVTATATAAATAGTATAGTATTVAAAAPETGTAARTATAPDSSSAPAAPAGARTGTGTSPAAETAPTTATSAASTATTTTSTTAASATATSTATSAASATATATSVPRPSADTETVPPLGRPNKPMIAAALLGGLVLIGVPFLVSGPDEKPRPSIAGGPAGSTMNPDGTGTGIVPSEQRLDAPTPGKGVGGTPGRAPGPVKDVKGLGPIGGIHEVGTGGTDPAGAPRATDAPRAPGSPKTTAPNVPGTARTTPTAPAGGAPASNRPAPNQPAPNRSSSAPKPPVAPAAVTYNHLIGLGCNTPGFAVGDMYTDGDEGWRKSWGSTTSYGCSGLYYSMPMSGSSRSDGIWAQWKFTTGSVQKGTCAVQVFIPNVRDISYVGGTPAHYTVYGSFSQSKDAVAGTFEINQPSHLGKWVSAGRFPVTNNKISVVLDNRGSGANNRHAAVAPVRVDCTAS
ncbi:hypothetical protein [Streptomyces sp. NPDC001744]|uniref:hypothetical protein n=1 Tax=Streptomyces sp. NPDC001744 TaxID=3364606 RepID=UPI0036CF217B